MDNIRGGSASTQLRPGPPAELVPGVAADDLFAASPVPHVVVAADGRCGASNAAFGQLLGVSCTDLVGMRYVELLGADERRVIPVPGDPREQRFTTAHNGDIWAVVSAGSLPRGRRLLSVQDVTARKRTEHDLVHAALHDSLTNLPNRRLLHDRLTTALARAARSHETVAVIFLDLDGFKAVNDTHGHQTGDALLVAIAGHLAGGLRSCDTVARLGGDEFVLVCSDLDGEDSLAALTERVQQAVRQPIIVRGQATAVSASLGVAVAGPWARTPAALLRLADVAMYHAKRNPNLPYVLADETLAAAVAQVIDGPYGPGSDRHAAVAGSRGTDEAASAADVDDPALAAELRLAIETDRLALHYQPIVTMDGTLVALEALLRWPRPGVGSVPPREVVAIAEGAGLGRSLHEWVLRRAIADAARWQDPMVRVSVNVTAREVLRSGFAATVLELLARFEVPPSSLGLDLCEEVFSLGADGLTELDRLRSAGVEVTVDGFGARPAGLPGLSAWPVDAVKVDAWLLETAADLPDAVRAARASGRRTSARTVETAADLQAARRLEVDTAQGYFVALPAPLDDLLRMIARRRVDLPT